jgi:hypothetical protein
LDEARLRSLTPADIIIVCPYNAQVVMIRQHARCGTNR